MNEKLLDLGLIVVNYLIIRSKTDPVIAEKIENGEPLTKEDLSRVTTSAYDAIDDLNDLVGD